MEQSLNVKKDSPVQTKMMKSVSFKEEISNPNQGRITVPTDSFSLRQGSKPEKIKRKKQVESTNKQEAGAKRSSLEYEPFEPNHMYLKKTFTMSKASE